MSATKTGTIKATKPGAAAKAKKAGGPIARAIGEMTDALRDEVEEIRQQVDQLTDHDIEVRWQVGKRLNAIVDDKSGKYGSDPKTLMNKVMPLSRDAIRPMMVLARTYSHDEVRRLRSYRNPQTKEGLTWSHVAALMRIKDKTKAFVLAEKAAVNGMSSRDLNAEVIRAGGGPKSKGGRKAKKAGTIVAALADIVAKCRQWHNSADDAWMGEGGLADLYAAESAGWPGKRPPQDVTDGLEAAQAALDDLIVKTRHVSHQVSSLGVQAAAARQARAALT